MRRTALAGGAFAIVIVLLVFVVAVRYGAERGDEAAAPASPASTAAPETATGVNAGFLYGRITTVDGAIYEGRLRWGGDQEAFWSDYFNGARDENPWSVHAPGQPAAAGRSTIQIFGFEIGDGNDSIDLARPFMARFGDIARIEAHVGEVLVTLKSGTKFELDRFAAGDIDDGVRVWDDSGDVVDLDARRIRTIEFLPTPPRVAAPNRLHGTVRTRDGAFTGFIQWDRHDCVGTDELDGRTADGVLSLPYGTIRSIARQSRDSVSVTLLDGRDVVLTGTSKVGHGNRGIYVDDDRYGRVRISWDAFDRLEFSPSGSGPAYGDFAAGRPLVGSVTTRDGRRVAGRLVYDFDESETTETLDTSFQGLEYAIPFGLISSIDLSREQGPDAERVQVMLRNGEGLEVERAADLADVNAGLLIFVEGDARPEYIRWSDVAEVELDNPTSGHR
jgi:hypothetical protein